MKQRRRWALILFGLMTLAITLIASQNGKHSSIHINIATAAIILEILTVLTAAIATKVSRWFAVAVVVCFLLVALTDSYDDQPFLHHAMDSVTRLLYIR